MYYLIDANNLAGKMRILRHQDFDRELIELIKRWPKLENNRVTLVFDPRDYLGDKETLGNLTVVYTPRDDHYRSADDKIVEIVEEYLYKIKEAKILRDELTVVTDDADIKKRVAEINNSDIHLESSVWLADKLTKISGADEASEEEEEDGRRGLRDKDINDINKELKKVWQ